MNQIILCPTRGGAASYANQDRAISLARERQAQLFFLYVAQVEFLGLTARSKLVDMATELEEMGEFLLAMAQERAEKAGVKAGAIVREGLFNQVLIDVIREYQVTSVVLGSSSGETAILTDEYVDRLVQDVRGETGVEFIIVSSGEVVNVHSKDE